MAFAQPRRLDYKMTRQERVRRLKAKINDAWDDPSPSRPADEAFERIHAEAAATSSRRRA